MLLESDPNQNYSSHKKQGVAYRHQLTEDLIVSEGDDSSYHPLQIKYSESDSSSMPAKKLFGSNYGENPNEIRFNNLIDVDESIADTSPMLGNHLFRMESSEALRNKPNAICDQQSSSESMDEDLNDSEQPSLAYQQEQVKIAVNFSSNVFRENYGFQPFDKQNNTILASENGHGAEIN